MAEFEIMEYPIVGIIGRRGAGKNLYLVEKAKEAVANGKNVFSNFKLIGIPYKSISYAEIEKIPDFLENGVLLLDELDVGGDSYGFMSPGAKALAKFSAQSRKRKITIYYSTQIFTKVPKRMRGLTDIIVEMKQITVNGKKLKGISKFEAWDNRDLPRNLIREGVLDGREHFGNYNTDEVVTYEGGESNA